MAYWVSKPRKKDPNSRVISAHFRVSRREYNSLMASARARGMVLSDYLRQAALGNIKKYSINDKT